VSALSDQVRWKYSLQQAQKKAMAEQVGRAEVDIFRMFGEGIFP